MSVPAVLIGLLEDARVLAGVAVREAVSAYRELGLDPLALLLGPLVVPDYRLAEVARAAAGDEPLSVCVVNTSGAGGLLGLAGRSWPEIEVVAVESALRDLDDLGGNAARVVAAAAALDSREVFVEIPYAFGWQRAVAVVEAGGLQAALRVDDAGASVASDRLAEQLSALIEADVPFKTTGRGRSPMALLAAVHALVEGADTQQAAQLLESDADQVAAEIATWGETTAARVRRRLRLVACGSVPAALGDLDAAGLISRA
ncbi:MAG TPA: hypothetical protein VEQ66_08305 [Propionibacteriaceae bacterium]|nr:hypothetical protein [Propionibacteriaceae bacterium]